MKITKSDAKNPDAIFLTMRFKFGLLMKAWDLALFQTNQIFFFLS